MKGITILGLLLSVGFVTASTRSDIELQYRRWARASVRNDVTTILQIISPDYTLKTFSGTVISQKEYEASLRKKTGKPSASYETHLVSVKEQGATALAISDETSITLSQDPITKKRVKLIHVHRYMDTWVKGATWRLKSTVTQTESTKIGK